MTQRILLLDDEPVILLDLELAVEDRGAVPNAACTVEQALAVIAQHSGELFAAVLDVSLSAGTDCHPVARELDRLGIPYILHSGDIDRHPEHIRNLDADRVSKPMAAEKVIAAAIAIAQTRSDRWQSRIAAE
ncbi:MAG: response regulator [Pseudomonadota bacterium]|nr:response regulator [Pseudomonadota bacterium]